MADPVTTKHSRDSSVTTFDLPAHAGEHNGWDKSRIHPFAHEIVVRSQDGTERRLSVGQLDIFLRLAENYRGVGEALNVVARAVPKPLRSVA